MKIKNLVAYAMLAFGAVAAPFVARADVAQGNVYAIDLVDDPLYGGIIPTEESPLLIGQRAVIRVRLLNTNWVDPSRAANPLPWKFYSTPDLAALSDVMKAAMSPKLGLMLGGQAVYADLLEVKAAETPNASYTDLFFSYVVKSGDLAMPAHLMNAAGKPASWEVSADYALLNMNYWELKNAEGTKAVFHFYNGGLTPDPRTFNVSGLGMGLFIKTVDLDKNYAKPAEAEGEPDIWRQIYKGMTTTTVYGLPTVQVEGKAESPTTMYVWVDKGEGDVTIASPLKTDGAIEVDGRLVLPVPVPASASTVAFKLKGIEIGRATVKMSSSKDLVYDDFGTLVTNWVERVIEVVPPPDPFVSIDLFDPSGKTLEKSTIQLTEDYENYAAMMTLTLSQEPSADLTVTLVPELDDGDIFDDGLLGISTTTDDSPWLHEDLEFTFKKGGSLSQTLFVYAKGTTSKLSTKGVKFTVNTSGAPEYDGESGKHSCNLLVKFMNPLLVKPAKGDAITDAMAGKNYSLDLVISDARKHMVDAAAGDAAYTVYYKVEAPGTEGEWDSDDAVSLDDADTGDATISVPFDIEGECTLKLYVLSPSGKKSAEVAIPVTVAAPKRATATLDRENGVYAEGETAYVNFHLTQKYKSELYAFLVPQDDDTKAKFETDISSETAGAIGFYIGPNETDTKIPTEIRVADGKAIGRFQVFMCTTKNYSKTKSAGYIGDVFTLSVTNVVPTVTSASMGGQTVKVNGGRTKTVAQNVTKKFTITLAEPSQLDLDATGADIFRTQWKFGTSDWQDMDGNPNLATTYKEWTFTSPGEQEVTVRCQDKDMRALGKWSEEFTFIVPVLDIPKVIITPQQERNQYYEDETGANAAFNVSLTAAPDIADSTKRLNVKLTVIDNSTKAVADTGLIALSRDEVTFSGGVLSGPSFFLTSLDGTAKTSSKGFTITATVTNPEIDTEGKTWDEGSVEVYILNRAPSIMTPSEKLDKDGNPIAATTTIGTENTLSWSLRDVDADSTGMTVTWETSEGQRTIYKQGTGPGELADVMSGTHTFAFSSSGEKSITITVTDKDGESDSRTFYYSIKPSKALKLVPHGPTAGKGTPYSKRYRSAAGIGEGRVYAKNVSQVEGFEALYNCGLNKSWTVYGYGYKVGEKSGAVGRYADRENRIDANGNSSAAGGYTYSDPEKDSFLYTWIQIYRKGGEGSDAGSVFEDSFLNGSTAPEYPEIKDVGSDVSLPAEALEDGSYDDTILEAVFSKEFLKSDNVGDINQDGIPDVVIDKYGFDIIDESGKVSGNDLDKVHDYNADEDYLPATDTSIYGGYIPGLPASWITEGRPFSAKTELRGYHDGLNDALQLKFADGVMNPGGIDGVKPDRVYGIWDAATETYVYDPTNCTISRLEFMAWLDSGLPMDKWSPERPTDPTMEDTDDDGFTDGYEYYFWYRAHVGWLENEGQKYERHRYLTGRRYDPARPAETNVISSAEIAALMDPVVAGGDKSGAAERDTDNDGLPDLIEFELGTNPFDWDTDGDGLPDGYEVAISKTDPLKWATNDVTCDADLNTDNDWMAMVTVKDQIVFGLDDGEGGIDYYTCGGTEPGKLAVFTNGPFATQVTVISNRVGGVDSTNCAVYVTIVSPVTWRTAGTNGEVALTCELPATKTWKLEIEEIETELDDGTTETNTYYVAGEPVAFAVGTVFTPFAKAGEEVKCPITANLPIPLYNRVYKIENDVVRYWKVWHYGRFLTVDKDPKKASDFVYGKEYNHASRQRLAERAVRVKAFKKNVHRLHYQVYQENGFDPRTAWHGTPPTSMTIALTHLDEFYTLAFFINDGVLEPPVPTKVDPWSKLWEKYSTSPISADTDEDAMPDGWELYLMTGPKVYDDDEKSDDYLERICDYGPRSWYSPLFDFNTIADGAIRDNDKKPEYIGADKLEWPDEYVGSESGQAYPECPTIQAFYDQWAQKGWRNKKWPTDPWCGDTDGDGLSDGEEANYFIYGSPTDEGMAGGGLDPLSWDTDKDGLPDPWEAEFAGTYVAGASTNMTSTTISEDKTTTNTVSTTLTAKGDWKDGMNGTVSDAYLDYDQDGLDNWQEYMVGTMRCWRYDDTLTPFDNMPMPAFDSILGAENSPEWDKFWYSVLVDEQSDNYNPHAVGGVCDNGASWFSQCTNSWDGACGGWYYFKDGVYHDLADPPDRYKFKFGDDTLIFNRFTWRSYQMVMMTMMQPYWINGIGNDFRVYPKKYISCDPRLADTDHDGMDDYYELFHGMNPLLGLEEADEGTPEPPQDVIYRAYRDGDVYVPPIASAKNNYWTAFFDVDWQILFRDMQPAVGMHWPLRLPKAEPVTKLGTLMDFEMFPWLNGLAAADADGDNIRNQQEAILSNLQAPSTYLHTDPTPLWMTDISDMQSFTMRFFRDPGRGMMMLPSMKDGFIHVDPNTGVTNEYKFSDFPLFSYNDQLKMIIVDEYTLNYWNVGGSDWNGMVNIPFFFSFEENEGYDSDHDYLSDFEEGQGKTKPASDPQNFDDPLRRQAMYFGGAEAPSFLQGPLEESETPPYTEFASEPRQNFLYYTVECWAKPDDPAAEGLQTIVERDVMNGEANPGDEKYIRRNFLIGIRNGRWYTKFDSSGTDSSQPVEITDGPQATTNWTHLAATYDGTSLRLYVDGICNNRKDTSVQPEHGTLAVMVDEASEMEGHVAYTYATLIVGASANGLRGMVIDYNPRIDPLAPPTSFYDYGSWYKGYVDEVRVWDGARAASDIRSDCQNKVRYNAALAEENRQAVFSNWRLGARRSPATTIALPPQLMYHYTFDHLPGAVRSSDVLRNPAGFTTSMSVTDAKAIWSRPDGWVSPWWAYTLASIRSSVYAKNLEDCAWVPWIANTVTHLPRFDGSTLDSVYWSETYAGRTPASEAGIGYDKFTFPRKHEVYSKWVQMKYAFVGGGPFTTHSHADFVAEIDTEEGALTDAYRFSMRDRRVVGEDLLPFGAAYPKRVSAAEGGMWDDEGAADAWAQTGRDSDNNGLPDWWQSYARANYCKGLSPLSPLGWDTTVTYDGVLMPAWQAYLRDLAAGMLPGAKVDPNYADTRDFDDDGMPDWWEEQNKVQGYSQDDADADPDFDGLSNYAEYLLGEVYPFAYGLAALDPEGYKQPRLDPQLAFSTPGQRIVDYFQSFSTNHVKVMTGAKTHFWLDEYFGEIATDHDFMEDWWENAYKNTFTSSKVYDPLDDKDEDGWSNWAECRASLWGGYFTADLIDSWTGGDSSQHVVNYPEPVIGVKVTYHGKQDVSGSPLVIRTVTGQTPRVDATFVVPADAAGQTRYIGPFRGDFAFHGHMSPGHVNGNSIVFERAKTSSDKVYTWNYNAYAEGEDFKAPGPTSGDFETYRRWFALYPKIELEGADLVWESFATASEPTPGTATVMLNGVKFGTVDTETGMYELDMSKFDGDAATYVFRVTYASRIGHEWPQAVYVSDTREFASAGGGSGEGDGEAAAPAATAGGNGHVREGRNTIEVFLDLNGNGLIDEKEPFGVARNVQVGWHRTPVVTVELREDSPVMPVVAVGGEGSEDGELTKTIMVFREAINEYPCERRLVTKSIVADDHPYVTELDVSTAAKPDLDWTWLLKDAEKVAAKNEEFEAVDWAVYRVDELVTVDGVTTTNTIKRFVKEFPKSRPRATAVSPVGSKETPAPVYSASPTLAFSVSDAKVTGYRLQIRKLGATSPVYDSGIAALPARVGSTVGAAACEVTPPVYAGAPVYTGTTTNREVFADGTNYQWRVALYNAKFNSTADDSDNSSEWSAWANFEMDICNSNRYPRFATGYGAAKVAVRYYGPATNDLRGKIVVEAFESADFRGQPLAQVRLGDLSDLRSLEAVTTGNALLRGIRPGTVFLRAFIDQNDNGSRDKWESWGYANMIGMGFKAIYNPDPLEVTVSTADWVAGGKADRVIYIEDCDANKDEQPDCLEPELFPEDISGDVDETEFIEWTEWAEADLDEYMERDVMAYREVTMKLVTLWDGADANVLKSYLLCDGQTTPVAGDSAAGLSLVTAWEYGTLMACGVPVPAADLAGLKVWGVPKDVKVALIHAQVREKYGFCSDTAVPGGKTDTKPFTAQDKYYVLRYLEQTGRLVETVPEGYKSFEDYVMNSGNTKLYDKYCLKPNVIDNDNDGVADGWELYVDTKPLSASDRESDWDGDGVPLWREYDFDPDTGLAHPTDPRQQDTDRDGIRDDFFHNYRLWDSAGDFDRDGLSNYAEYLISEVFELAKVDPRKSHTSDGIHDYFRKVGDLYLGEIFTDHDQMNDAEEETFPWASRSLYDAHLDSDGDGWSNWAEVCGYGSASTNVMFVGVKTNVVTKSGLASQDEALELWTQHDPEGLGDQSGAQVYYYTDEDGSTKWAVSWREFEDLYENVIDYSGMPRPEIRLTLSYLGNQLPSGMAGIVTVKTYTDGPQMLVCDAVYQVSNVVRGVNNLMLTADRLVSGAPKEGRNWISASLAVGGDEEPSGGNKGSGETENATVTPMGFAIADIGWAKPSVRIDLTDVTAVGDRIDAYAGTSMRKALQGTPADSALPADDPTTEIDESSWAEEGTATAARERVRIVPYAVRGTIQDQSESAGRIEGDVSLLPIAGVRVAADFYVDVKNHPFISEADFIDEVNGVFDLDWKTFSAIDTPAVNDAVGDITLVKYRVYFGEEQFLGPQSNLDVSWTNSTVKARLLGIPLERRFEPKTGRTPSVAVSPLGGVVYSARPTFKWRLDEPESVTRGCGSSYTAFNLKIQTADKKPVFESGMRRAPAKDAEGNFVWTGPVLAPGDYLWQVEMFNAKFQVPYRGTASALTKFSMAAGVQQDMNDHGYGAIAVAVKYAGPANVLASGIVRVQAFDTPDFSGEPLAETYLTNNVLATTLADALPNCRLAGLAMGGTYYVRAFIDLDADGSRAPLEPWGSYKVNNADTLAAPVKLSGVTSPVIGVFVEDCDTDQDWLPDAWEYVKNGGDLNAQGAVIDPEGKIVFRGNTYEGIAGISTGLPGATLSVFNNLEVAKTMLGLSGEITIDAIRSAVEKKIVENSVKITALTFDQENGKVILNVDADVAESVAGQMLSKWYTVVPEDTVTVKVHVYKTENLASAVWPEVSGSPFTKTFGASEQKVEIDLGGGDYTSGFYKVVIEQE